MQSVRAVSYTHLDVYKRQVIRYCENKASVQGYFTVGGIAGAVRFGGSVRNSSNWGKISGVSILGGIAGLMNEPGTYSDGTVKQCLLKDVRCV